MLPSSMSEGSALRSAADDSWHTCVAHMDVRGIDDVTMETSSETECAQVGERVGPAASARGGIQQGCYRNQAVPGAVFLAWLGF